MPKARAIKTPCLQLPCLLSTVYTSFGLEQAFPSPLLIESVWQTLMLLCVFSSLRTSQLNALPLASLFVYGATKEVSTARGGGSFVNCRFGSHAEAGEACRLACMYTHVHIHVCVYMCTRTHMCTDICKMAVHLILIFPSSQG